MSEADAVGGKKEADFHLQPSHVDATQEGIKVAFLRDLDLHTFPVSRYRERLLTLTVTRSMTWYSRWPKQTQPPRAFNTAR